MKFSDLNDENFTLYAMQNYSNPQCMSTDEFYCDLNRIRYIIRLLNKYEKTGVLRERLILNHIIVFYNMFDPHAATRILFYKIKKNQYHILKTFLDFLRYMPDAVDSVNGNEILTRDIGLDKRIKTVLENL